MDWTLGQYNQFIMQSTFMILIFSFGVFSSVQYFIGKKLLHPKLASRKSLYLLLLAMGFISLAHHYQWINIGFNYTSAHFSYLILSYAAFGIWQEFNYAICISTYKISQVNTWILIGPISLSILYAIHILGWIQMDLQSLVMFAVINQFYIGLVSSILIFRDNNTYTTGKFPIKEFLSFGGIVYISNILQFLVYRFDYWVLEKEDLTHFAFYTLASQMISFMWFFPQKISDISFVATVESPQEMAKKTSRLILYSFLIQLIVGLGVLGGLFIIFYLLGMVDFYQSLKYFLILLPSSILFGIALPLSAYQAGTRKLWVNLWGSAFACVLAIILSYWLIPKYGVWGTLGESSIVYAFTFIYHIYYFTKYCKISYKSLLSSIKQEGKKILNEKNFSISEHVFNGGKKK